MSVHDLLPLMPGIARTRQISQAIAMLDAVLCPDASSRCYSFDAEWAPDEALASMHNGSGEEYSIVFSPAGACARGFDHESLMSPYRVSPLELWPGLVETVPASLRSVVEEPAFSEDGGILLATVVLWREAHDPGWSCGDVQMPPDEPDQFGDGADDLFALLSDGRPEAYQEYAQEYFGQEVDLWAVRKCYDLRPLTRAVVTVLNPELDLADLEPDRRQIGYPAPDPEELPPTSRRSLWGWPLL